MRDASASATGPEAMDASEEATSESSDPVGLQMPDESLDSAKPGRERVAFLALGATTFALVVLLVVEAIVPGYRQPTTRSYGTKIGYPSLLRHLGRPIPVETATVEERSIVRAYLGEGTMSSDPVLVPMVPVGKITGVYVQPGQRVHKGELLAEMESRKGMLAAETARLAFLSADAELKRVKIGSVVVLNREQPGLNAIDVKALRDQVGLLREEIATKEKLYDQALVSKEALLESKRTLAETEQAFDAANLSLQMSVSGKSESERIAANNMQQAVLAWQEKLEELSDYKITAPADGIVDRVLVHVGEYNQSQGSPAVVLAAGLWFEGYFDQTAMGDLAKDAKAEVHLAARPDVAFEGRVASVNPIVSYGIGGPETSRPIRPTGTAAPEWPATFKVRIDVDPASRDALVPGLTGFARVTVDRRTLAVPQAAMVSMSSGSALLFVAKDTGWQTRRARYGAASGGWVEVLDGASAGEKVIVEGQRVLEPGDRVRGTPWQSAEAGK
jgi:multidrug efflux pump subunit AcrA (membrane-fusion protein)